MKDHIGRAMANVALNLARLLWLSGAFALVSCERSTPPSQAEEIRFRPSFLHSCFYEATLPKGTSLDEASKLFRNGEGQFCSWTSLEETKFIGMVWPTKRPTDVWSDLNNRPQPYKEVCDMAQVKAASTALAPLNFKSGEEFQRRCGATPPQLRDKSELIPLEPALAHLQEICFGWSATLRVPDVEAVLAFTSNLHSWYTLPVRYAFATKEVLRVWADPADSPFGHTPELIEWSAQQEGFTLRQRSCHEA